MNKTETIRQLKAMGTAQNRKVYARHGVTGPMYGVSYANFGKLRRAIKTDHALARRLWATGNFDARILATMIADPEAMATADLNEWVEDIDNYGLAGAFSELAYRTRGAFGAAKRWSRSRDEWKGCCGWNMIGHLASHDDSMDESFLATALETIESKIHRAPNRTRYSMIRATIAIGKRNAKLKRLALAAAKRIGHVEVDHGETSCKTPDAVVEIMKAKSRHG